MKGELKEAEAIIREVLESGGEFRLSAEGTSMQPLIQAGRDSVVLVKAQGRYRRGDLILYKRDDGSFVLHRIMAETANGFVLCGDNQTTLEPGVRTDQIIGKVKVIHRNGKALPEDALTYRIYCLVWQNLTMRRSLLRIHRGLAKLRKTN